jgi:hypothetical protein
LRPFVTRTIQPDPDDYLRIGVVALEAGGSLHDPHSELCAITIDRTGGGAGCGNFDRAFDRKPFTFGSSSSGSQYSVLAGLASDDVARLELFSRGDRTDVPLRDNAWLVRVAGSDYPLRLVAYDDAGRVIGIDPYQSNGNTSRAPARAKNSVRRLARIVGESGQTATLRAGTPADGYRCFWIEVSNRGGGGGCTGWPVAGDPLAFVEGAATHGDVFFTGPLPPAVTEVSLSYPNGGSAKVEPISSFLVYAVPHRFIGGLPIKVTLRAFDAKGRQLDERTIEVTR